MADKKPLATIPAPRFTKKGWDLVLEHWQDAKAKLTYEEHLAQERKLIDALEEQQIAVEIIELDAAKMLAWLKAQGLKNNGQGRAAYLGEVARCKRAGRGAP
jgi:hypothetical protein